MKRKTAQPHLIVLAGPNGAGKSTAAPELLARTLGVTEFVNADVIAQGLSGFEPNHVAMEAGRIMLRRLRELAEQRRSFAFETTLAARTYAPWIANLRQGGYAFHLHYLWLSSADLSVARVQQRVLSGGHSVPEVTVRRRYDRGIQNFLHLYRPLATTWRCYDNSGPFGYNLIARGGGGRLVIKDRELWQKITAI